MLRAKNISFLFLICFVLWGCGKMPSQQKIDELQREISSLKYEIYRVNAIVNHNSSGSAEVNLEDNGYSIARTQYGSFVISSKNVTPYLDGYKVLLDIGNLTTAEFRGANIKLLWGKDLDMSKDLNVTNRFSPGRYTTIEVVIAPAKPEDIKTFSVTLRFDQMALY